MGIKIKHNPKSWAYFKQHFNKVWNCAFFLTFGYGCGRFMGDHVECILKPGDKLSNIYGLPMSPALMASEPVHLGKACCHSESYKEK